MRTADEDKGKGLPGILGVDNAQKKLVNPGVKYPKSKLVREALIPKRKREHTYTTCACGNVDYKTLVYLAKTQSE